MSNIILISVPERNNGRFTGSFSDMTPMEALARVAGQIARRPVPLPIQHYETAEMILLYAENMSASDADALARAFGPFPTLEVLRASVPEIAERMYRIDDMSSPQSV